MGAEDTLREVRLKKLKLRLKDQMVALLSRTGTAACDGQYPKDGRGPNPVKHNAHLLVFYCQSIISLRQVHGAISQIARAQTSTSSGAGWLKNRSGLAVSP